MRDPSNDAQFIGKYRHLGGQIFETLGQLVGRPNITVAFSEGF
jgi:hypothetical protein